MNKLLQRITKELGCSLEDIFTDPDMYSKCAYFYIEHYGNTDRMIDDICRAGMEELEITVTRMKDTYYHNQDFIDSKI